LKKALWLTDIHLNFLDDDQVMAFLRSVKQSSPDTVWISGDIGESEDVEDFLFQLQDTIEKPIFFVLGNHDFYKSSIKSVHSRVKNLCRQTDRLVWLTDSAVVEISKGTALMGHDSWVDGRLGDYSNSNLLLNDYILIEEFNPWMKKNMQDQELINGGMPAYMERLDGSEARKNRLETMQSLAQEAVVYLHKYLPQALDRYENVYFLTHAPPFKDACLHHGRPSSETGLPHFTSKLVGDTILDIMQGYPDRILQVLCGHTHSQTYIKPMPNVHVYVGGAVYGSPSIQAVLRI
jgi:predicted MPP superfamily phosphohydrolase